MGLFGVPCAGCARQLRIDAEACWGCGRRITDQERADEHARRVARGRRWTGWVAILFAVSGMLGFAMQSKAVEDVVDAVRLRVASRGTNPTAEELSAVRDRAERRGLQNIAVNLTLAALFGVCWWRARRSPIAAFAFAMALLLGLWIVSGMIDRSTLLDGFVIKLFALGAFGAGLRAALAARKAVAATP